MRPKTAKVVTASLMISSVTLWIAWDVIVVSLGLHGATESQILLTFAHVNVFLPSATGFVLGHLWWPAPEVARRRLRIVIAVTYGVTLFALNVARVVPALLPVVPLVAHVPLGRLLWPQSMRLLKPKEVTGGEL